ncbi:hypothetical protein [Xanthomonas fragariae]|uniref:hypothetical protein n=1 Tax=Xanthomonas fragariae TaxID=48664 RepID=UPI001ABE590A|nr:hypothetical protein [Xanthomonas fragariae]UKR52158.1 hypothetical protein K4A87_16225 [Xanthomonas fragariae]
MGIAILSLTDGGVSTPASSPTGKWPYGLQSELSNTLQYNRLQAHAAAQFIWFFKEIYSIKEICCGAALQSIAKISR